MTVTPFWGLNMATGVLVQEDSKLVLSFVYGPDGAFDVGVMRFLPNGSYDFSFGTGGIATLSVSPGDELASGLASQSDGSIVLAGSSDNFPNYDMFIARFSADGVLDTGFGSDGITLVSVSALTDRANDLVIQGDDAILLGGRSDQGGGTSTVAVVRLDPNGHLDTTFGYWGIVLTQVPEVPWAAGYDIGLQPDGRVVVAAGGGPHPLLLRYLAGPFIGIEESKEWNGVIAVLPNPAMGQAVVQYELRSSTRVECHLVDAHGRTVRSFFNAFRGAGSHMESLDVSDLLPGAYTIVIRDATERRTARLMKQ